jgi:transcriptional regulator with XRE-family HTH domain
MPKHIFVKYREENDLSQEELAGKLGVSRQMVSFIENGERDITPENASSWGRVLGIPREKLHPIFSEAA